jgi:D-serine dehydratase
MENSLGQFPLIPKMQKGEEVFWINENLDNRVSREITKEDIADASERLKRFAPYIKRAFPETAGAEGVIESPLREIKRMKDFLSSLAGTPLKGRLLLKCDNLLPISGSVKARGGIYEALCFAEKVAMENGLLQKDSDYAALGDERLQQLFSGYSIAVGSTGTLGLSIGIIGSKLGFRVTVHMSSDAKQWKKDLLREKGALVVEYAGDYQKAVAEGRRLAEQDPLCHFVDDENSRSLFLGYAVAAERLERQLTEMSIVVDDGHPLFVYLPCGVGGGPGGISFGLKQIYGKNVHCIFAEPAQAPCMLLGVMTGLHDRISVQDIGLTGKTSADGLAVGRPSRLVGRVVGNLLDGLFTVADQKMERLVVDLFEQENIFVEPSAAAGFPGYWLTQQTGEYAAIIGAKRLENAAHIVWATGGGMVPEAERERYLGDQTGSRAELGKGR